MNRLRKINLIKHERIFYGLSGVYRLTEHGAKFTDLPASHRVSLAEYHHNITIIDVYLKVMEQYPDADWISERQLKNTKYFSGVGKKGHLPDAILSLKEEDQIAIEVELTPKNKTRLTNIINHYKGDLATTEVWYFVNQFTKKQLQQLSNDLPYIKIYDLKEFLG